MKMKMTKLFSMLLAISLLFNISCTEDDPIVTPKGAYENGFLVANEGNFGSPNASVSFISKDLSTIENNIFSSNNSNAALGDVLQSIGFSGDWAYFVANNSNKVVVANRYTMKKEAEMTSEINQPRYIAFANNFIYVTNDAYGGDKFLSIFKNSDRSFVKKIPFTETTERVVEAGAKIFVQHASYGFGNKISVVETSGNTVSSTITLPAGQINKIVSNNSSVYAIAADGTNSYIYQYSSAGSLVKTTNLTGLSNATNLDIEGTDFYFSNGTQIYKMAMNATTVPSSIITVTDNSWSTLYGMNVIDGKIFTSDANGATADSKITVYSTSGNVLKTFDAGRSTNGFYQN